MNSKHPLASKTIWGAIITVLGMLAQQFGVDITGAQASELAGALAAVGGVVLTVYGRYKASQPIGKANGAAGAIAALIMAGVLSACAVSKAETPAQRVYALEVEYQNVARSILAYGTSDVARPDVVDHLKRLDRIAFDALTTARVSVRSGDNVTLNAALTTAYSALNEIITYLKQKGAFDVTSHSRHDPPACGAGAACGGYIPALHRGTG